MILRKKKNLSSKDLLYLKSYMFRKISVIIIFVFAISSIVLMASQHSEFYDYMRREKVAKAPYLGINKAMTLLVEEQKPFFEILFRLVIFLLAVVSFLSGVAMYLLFSRRSSSTLLLRMVTWILILAIAIMFVISSIKLYDISFRDKKYTIRQIRLNPEIGMIYVKDSTYAYLNVSFALVIIAAILSGASRNNFGFLKRNINIIGWKRTKNNDKK